jgi:outer membrane lipoprotein-sorting protein
MKRYIFWSVCVKQTVSSLSILLLLSVVCQQTQAQDDFGTVTPQTSDFMEYGESAAQIQGQIQLKGDKFKLDVGEMITWFDGKNQWFYLVNIQEVNLSNPAPEDLMMINPVMVFQLYKYGFDTRYAGEKKLGTKIAQQVELLPQEPYSDIQRIEVSFDKQTYQPLRIRIRNKDQSGSLINIDKYITDQKYPDAMFVFQQKAYPGAVVIDLR